MVAEVWTGDAMMEKGATAVSDGYLPSNIITIQLNVKCCKENVKVDSMKPVLAIGLSVCL